MLRSRGRALEMQQVLMAWHAAVTINHNGMVTKAVQVDDLLGRGHRIDLVESPHALDELEELEIAHGRR